MQTDKPRQNSRDDTISKLEAEVRVRKSFESVDFSERDKSSPESDNEVKSAVFSKELFYGVHAFLHLS